MLIQVYLVESHRHGPIDDLQPASSPVGAVQFTGNIAQERGEEVAMELRSRFSPLTRHPTFGAERWEAELTSVEDDSLDRHLLKMLRKAIESGFLDDCLSLCGSAF